MTHRNPTLLAGTTVALALAHGAWAEDQSTPFPIETSAAASAPAASPAPAPPVASTAWFRTVKVKGQVESGITVNPAGPDNGINFGHLFTDRANKYLLNQATLTFERDIDPKATGIDVGFKVQGLYGSDARYTHFIGELDRVTGRLNQVDLVEANVTVHLPVLTKGGIDVKAGQYVTPLGEETIDPSGNFFYSHSYLFNFGIPFKHTGVLATTHVNPVLDIYTGYDTGVNTSLGTAGGFNDARFHYIAGFGLNFSRVTVLALTHIGPELPGGALGPGINVGDYNRYLSDVLVTWKITDKLTSITEGNYIVDDGAATRGGGVVQYFTYVLSPEITAGVRAEAWRDAQGFYVAAFPGNLDFIDAATGRPNGSSGGGTTTYGAIALGMNLKPSHLPKPIDGTTIRPEVRFDTVLAGGTTPFSGFPGGSRSQFTFGIDLLVPLNFH